MTSRHTFFWLFLAGGLFAFIFLYERHARNAESGPERVLPNFKPAEITSIEVLPKGLELGICVERTNSGWRLTRPVDYPAQSDSIEKLLSALEALSPARRISERELATNRFNAGELYGFSDPQATVILRQGGELRLRLGRQTAPGDQVFLQVVGLEGISVVSAELLELVPQNANAWRDTALLESNCLATDRLTITNGSKALELRRNQTNGLWHIAYPKEMRANSERIAAALQQLQTLRVSQFVSDDPKADPERFGLQPPELELTLAQNSNVVAVLQFGKTNGVGQVYARRAGRQAILAVAQEPTLPWRAALNDFRAARLVTLVRPVGSLEVHAEDSFSLVRQTNGGWRVLPQDFPADSGLVKELLGALGGMPIVDFTADVVTELALPKFGLAPPARRYVVRWADTNTVPVELDFGATNGTTVSARRADETSVYGIRLADFQRLPASSWQLRERRVWGFNVEDVARLTLQQGGRVRQLLHGKPYEWSLAPGSQGLIDDQQKLALEETVRGLVEVSAVAWLARGPEARAGCGFAETGQRATLELRNGQQTSVDFGASSGQPCAAVTLEGETWILELPALLYRDVASYLAVPPNP